MRNGFAGYDAQIGKGADIFALQAFLHYLPCHGADFGGGVGYGGDSGVQIRFDIVTAHDGKFFADGDAVVGAEFVNIFQGAAGDDKSFGAAR